eukprot:553178_1
MAVCIFVIVSGLAFKMLPSVHISFWSLLIGITFLIALIFVSKCIFMYYRRLYFKGANSIFLSPFIPYSKTQPQWLPPLDRTLKIGGTLVRDFREQSNHNHNTKRRLKIVSFNIEKGRKIDQIIELFKSLDADVYCLQEVDVNTQRAFYVDILGAIGVELKLNTLFCCEQIISSDASTWKDNTKPKMIGYEGNAILTKYDFVDTNGLIIDCVRNKYKHETGRHNQCCSIIQVHPDVQIGVFSLHLDPHHCGVDGRVKQYLDVLEYVKKQRSEHKMKHQIICGDMNTVCNGIARLNFGVSPDRQSIIGTLGMTESEYFDIRAVNYGNLTHGLDFDDPFDKLNDFTFHSFHGLYKGKLDWCLLSKSFRVIGKYVGDVQKRCSDHQWIMVETLYLQGFIDILRTHSKALHITCCI